MIIVMIIIIIVITTTIIIVNHFPLFVLRLFFIFLIFWLKHSKLESYCKKFPPHHHHHYHHHHHHYHHHHLLKQLCLWVADTPTLKATPSSVSFAAPSRDQSAVARGGPPRSACPVVAVAAIACGQLAAAEAGTDRRLRLRPRPSPGQRRLKAAGLHSHSRR